MRRGELVHVAGSKLDQRGAELARELAHAAMKVAFECRQPRVRALESLLRRACGGDADFRQACGLLPQLRYRLLVEFTERGPLTVDDAFELLQAIAGILLNARGGILPLIDM